MSGVVKSVGKVFKSVTKSAVGKVVVGAAAAYFTAGLGASLLNATGLAGSLSPTLGTVLSHAISGAAAGGLTSAITGGKIGQGIALGGAGGAILGGVRTMMGHTTPGDWRGAETQTPAQTASGAQAVGPQSTAAITNTNVPEPGLAGGAEGIVGADQAGFVGGEAASAAARTGLLNPAATTTAQLPMPPTPRPEAPGFFQKGGWLDRNPSAAIVGAGAIGGVGQGAAAAFGADDAAKAAKKRTEMEIEAERDKAARIAGSHTGVGLLNPASNNLNTSPRPTPSQKFDPKTYGGRYVWNPQRGEIEFVPNQA